jgi:plastocyanin
MTDTTTLDDEHAGAEEELPELVESEHLGADAPAEDTPLKTRLLLPILVPLLSMAIVAVLVLNISRVFLAGDKDAALVMGIVLTLAILVGASLLAAAPRLKTASLALILGCVFVFVTLAGLISLGPSLDTGESATGFQYATGPAKTTLSVTAGPGLTFEGKTPPNELTLQAAPGVVQINYGGNTGHTFAIQDPKYDGFLLGTDAGQRHSGKIDLPAGTYTFYCTVPGHEAAGMKGTLTVG